MTRRLVVLLSILAALAIAGPWLAPYRPEVQYREFLFAPPMPPRIVHDGGLTVPFVYPLRLVDLLSLRYEEDRSRPASLPWFRGAGEEPAFLIGADSYGRDLFSRLLHGARVSMGLALLAAAVSLLIGAVIGALAGYRGGWLDDVAMRSADLVIVLPVIYVALVLRAMMPLVLSPPRAFLLMTAIFALVGWPFTARGVRGIVATEREREYVIAARSMGASTARIVSRHLLPACAGYLLVQATLLLPAFILGEATLSYAGVGFQSDIATWGTMLREAGDVNALSRFPWILAPAAAIFLVVLTANVLLQSDKIGRPPL